MIGWLVGRRVKPVVILDPHCWAPGEEILKAAVVEALLLAGYAVIEGMPGCVTLVGGPVPHFCGSPPSGALEFEAEGLLRLYRDGKVIALDEAAMKAFERLEEALPR